jgi:DNA recombination protein RmuC
MDTALVIVIAILVVALLSTLAATLVLLMRHRSGAANAAPDESLHGLRDSLDRLDAHMREVERQRAREQAELRTGLETSMRVVGDTTERLRRETGQLAAALGRTQIQGRWGEAQLRRLVEAAGMLDQVHFVEQATHEGDAGRLRPDLLIRLGDDRELIVDAKVPLTALIEAEACDDPVARNALYARHAADVAAHVDRLGSKEYWRHHDDTVEMVVLFLPAESMLGIALTHEPGLLERAFQRHVVIATPTTMLALLRTVTHVWRRESIATHAKEIHALGVELYQRLSTVNDHLRRVGSSLDTSVENFNKLIASMESRVLVTGRKMAALGVGDTPIEHVPPITVRSRMPIDPAA